MWKGPERRETGQKVGGDAGLQRAEVEGRKAGCGWQDAWGARGQGLLAGPQGHNLGGLEGVAEADAAGWRSEGESLECAGSGSSWGVRRLLSLSRALGEMKNSSEFPAWRRS